MTHTCLALHEFRKQDTCLEIAAFVSKCKRQNCEELLIICGTPHGVWQKLAIDLLEHSKALCNDS